MISTPQNNVSVNTLFFSGHEWNVKTSVGDLIGPGPNFFNDSSQNVWVDSNGSLHLRITHEICKDAWYCAEVFSIESFGYGTYEFILAPDFETLDRNVVLGLFTYLDDFNEIDIEFAKWGQIENDNGQYAIQPSWKLNHKKRFDFDPQGEDSIHGFKWCKNAIQFWSYTKNKGFCWTYYGPGIPTPSAEHVNMNLWLMQGLAPSNKLETEVIVKSFKFIPSDCVNSLFSFWWVFSFSLIAILGITICLYGLLIKKKKNSYKNTIINQMGM